MARAETRSGYVYDIERLDRVERRFWRDLWESVPEEVAREHGVELHELGPVQATLTRALAERQLPSLVLGAAREGAVAGGALAAALDRIDRPDSGAGSGPDGEARVDAKVPISPGEPEAEAAVELLRSRGYEPGYAWMKFVRDAHEPRFRASEEVEVRRVEPGDESPFGAIAATGFGLPAWAAVFFAGLPGRDGWHCYLASVGAEPQACAAMLVDGEVAQFGIAATLEPARGRGCQPALLRRRILDAAAAGCTTLFVETGERVPDRPSPSYRNILGAGFEEAYLRPNWSQAA
jgi:GNAT superfamily N-acetyltransferase